MNLYSLTLSIQGFIITYRSNHGPKFEILLIKIFLLIDFNNLYQNLHIKYIYFQLKVLISLFRNFANAEYLFLILFSGQLFYFERFKCHMLLLDYIPYFLCGTYYLLTPNFVEVIDDLVYQVLCLQVLLDHIIQQVDENIKNLNNLLHLFLYMCVKINVLKIGSDRSVEPLIGHKTGPS